jgi:glucose dehydrogenase
MEVMMQIERLGIVFVAAALLAGVAVGADWPQHQHDAARTGFTTEEIPPPHKIVWTYNFLPERPARRTQAVVYDGKVFVGTQQGTMYCFDAATGTIAWQYRGAGSIQHSAAGADGKVFFSSLDGHIYAVNIDGGELAWKTPTDAGFSVAPLIADGKIFAGNRRGTFFALDPADGSILWERKMGEPILNSAAYGDGLVYFGTEDMRVHALYAQTGKIKWSSEQVAGMTFKDNHPVVHKGYVLIRPMTSFEADIYDGYSAYGGWPDDLPGGWWAVWTQAPAPLPNFKERYEAATRERAGEMPAMLLAAQEPVIEHFTKNPSEQDMFVLDAKTGKQPFVPPHFRVNSIHGPVTPPVLDAEGTLIVPWVHINNCWGRYDIERNRMVEFIIPPKPTNADNTVNISCGGRYVYIFHCTEGNAQYTGIYDLKAKKFHDFPAARVPWYDALESGSNPVSIGAGHYYHIYFWTLIARTGAVN